MIKESGNKSLLKTYQQHFSNHPLALAAKRKTSLATDDGETQRKSD